MTHGTGGGFLTVPLDFCRILRYTVCNGVMAGLTVCISVMLDHYTQKRTHGEDRKEKNNAFTGTRIQGGGENRD